MAACVAMGTHGFADNNIWQAVDSDYNGDYTTVAHWNQGHIPTTNEYAFTSAETGATYTMTFPDGVVESYANWKFRSNSSGIVTVDGRGTTFTQPAMDATYSQWESGMFEPSLLKLERNSAGAQLYRQGLYFDDFLFVHSNAYHVILKDGTFDFTRNGGRTVAFSMTQNITASLTIESGATLMTAGYLEWRSCCSNSLIDVNGGTLQGYSIYFPTGEGYNTLSGVEEYLTCLTVRNGGTVACSADLVVGNSLARSTNRLFTLSMSDDSSASFFAIKHTYGDFALNMTGGSITLSDCIKVAQGAGSKVSLNLTGGTINGYGVVASSEGTSFFHADGATIHAIGNSTSLLQGFGTATLGAQGLIVDSDYANTMAQSLTDADGADGKLVKTGTGTLTMTGTASEFDTLELRGGGLVLADSSVVRTKLVVANGFMPTIYGSALTNTLAGLTLGDASTLGRLEILPGATLHIAGPLELPNARLVLGDSFEIGKTYDLIVAQGTCSDAASAWGNLVVGEGCESGKAYTLTSSYDSESDKTTFSMSVSEATVVEKNVTENETLSDPVSLGAYGTYDVTVDEGKTFSVEAALECGMLLKDGTGWMTLASDLVTPYTGVYLLDGTLAFASPFSSLNIPLQVNKSSGTTVIHTEDDVTFNSMSVTSGGWIKHGPGTLTILNDGSSVQTLTATNGMVGGNGTPGGTEVHFGADYPPPTTSWTGLSIAEGTVHLKGTGDNAKFYMPHSIAVGMPTGDGTAQPRLVVDGCEAWTGRDSYHFFIAPNMSSSADTYFATEPELVLTNSAKMRVDTLCVGDGGYDIQCTPKMTIDGSTFLSGFKLQFSRGGREFYHPEYVFRNGAHVYTAHAGSAAERTSASIEFMGTTTLTCDNSVLAGANSYSPSSPYAITLYTGGPKTHSTLNFCNGAQFWCWQIATGEYLKKLEINFDDATWEFGAGTNLCTELTGVVTLNVEDGGLTVNATTDDPLRVRQPFTGSGVLTKTGSATMWFDERAYWNGSDSCAVVYEDDSVTLACDVMVAEGDLAVSPGAASGTNTITLAEGTSLDLTDGTVGGLILSGAGTVGGGTLDAPVLKPAFNSEWTSTNGVLTLAADCAVSGILRVDLGCTAESPLLPPYPRQVLVAQYEGDTAPDVTEWNIVRSSGTRGLRSEFTAEDGEIVLTVRNPSTLIIFH